MFTIRRLALLTFASLALAISVGTAVRSGTRMGEWGWGQGRMGPGMMLGPGLDANTL